MRVKCPQCKAFSEMPEGGTQAHCARCGHEFRVDLRETVLFVDEERAESETAPAPPPSVQAICTECGSVLDVEQGTAQVRCPRCGKAYPVLGRSLQTAQTLAVSEVAETIAAEEPGTPGASLTGTESPAPQAPAGLDDGSRRPVAVVPETGLVDTQPRSRRAVVGEPRASVSTQAAPPDFMQRDLTGLSWLREHLGGKYEVLEFLGRGGMGAVYKARQRTPSRVVALKVMLGGALVSERARKRFEREAMAAGSVQHAAIVPVYEVGDVGGQPYYTMEFVEGQDLRTHVLANGLGRRQICELMAQVCRAVDFAHTHGIIHRDLKPGNILVDDQGRCRLLDFGLARIAREDEDGHMSLLTVSGDILGTPRYMSPEQATGKPKEIDGRTDVYSLGVMFYELLVGMPPYNLDGLQGYQALEVIRHGEPLRPSLVHPWFPTDLEAILLRALEKEKTSRYRSAQALADDIESFLADRPVTARPATAGYRFRKFIWRNRRAVFLAIGALCVLVLMASMWRTLWKAKADYQREIKKAEDAKPIVLQRVEEGKWSQALGAAEYAEQMYPDHPSVKGVVGLVTELAETRIAEAIAGIDGLIRAQDYDRAKEQAAELESLARRMPFAELEQKGRAKAAAFADDCWADVRTVVEDAHVYTRDSSVSFVSNFLARFGEGPYGEEARGLLRRLEEAPDVYFLEQRARALEREMTARNWDNAVAILKDAGKAVLDADVADKEAWNSKFAAVQAGLDSIIWHSTAGGVDLIRKLEGHEGMVKGVCFEPRTGNRIASGASDGAVRLWDSASGELVDSLACSGPVRAVAFSPDGAQVAAACEDSAVYLWRLADHTSLRWDSGHGRRLQAAAFTPDGRLLMTACSDAVRLWDLSGQQPTEARQLVGAKAPAVFVAAGDLLAAAMAEGGIALWHFGSGKVVKALPCPSLPLSLAASADRKLLAAGCMDNNIRIWDLKTGSLLHTLAGHSRNVAAVALSPDGRILASGGLDDLVILWDLRAEGGTPRELKRLKGHEGWIADVAFSPDGKVLASGSNDKTVRIWGVKRPSGAQ